MINPDKYIRKAFYDRLTSKGLLVYDKAIPNTVAAPPRYALISSQTKLRKHLGRGCMAWDCTIVIDVFSIQALSYVASSELNDYVEVVMDAIYREAVTVQNFNVISLSQDGTTKDLSYVTDTQSIGREVIIYRLLIEQGDNALANVRFLEDGSVRLLEN